MDLTEFHHSDGRPVSFARQTVLLVEPHESGNGTRLRLGPTDRTIDLHVREDYAAVMKELNLTTLERIMRGIVGEEAEAEASRSV